MRSIKVEIGLLTVAALVLAAPSLAIACSEHKDGHAKAASAQPAKPVVATPLPSLGKTVSVATVVAPAPPTPAKSN